MTIESTVDDELFQRSSFCGDVACVEVAALPNDEIAVRGTNDRAAVLRFTATEWDVFLRGVQAGEFTPAALRGR